MAEEYDEEEDEEYEEDINALDDDDYNEDDWYDDEEDEEDEEDVNAIDDDDYDEDDWYEDEADEEYDEEVDDDQVVYVDEEGWFYADEETINAIDEQLAKENEEFAGVLATYVEARGALAKARIARGFYLVVVPQEAVTGYRPRFGRAITVKPEGGKGKTKGRGKGKRPRGPPRPKAKARPNAKPPPPPRPSWGDLIGLLERLEPHQSVFAVAKLAT